MYRLIDLEVWGRLLRNHHIFARTWSKVGVFGLSIGYNLGIMRKISCLYPSGSVVHLYLNSNFFLKTTDKTLLKKSSIKFSILTTNVQKHQSSEQTRLSQTTST
jgi:hypothetical protein